MAGTSVGLFESQNGGVDWVRIPNDGLNGQVTSVLFLDNSGNRILAANRLSSAILYSQDGGQNWDKIHSPQFESPIFCLAKDPYSNVPRGHVFFFFFFFFWGGGGGEFSPFPPPRIKLHSDNLFAKSPSLNYRGIIPKLPHRTIRPVDTTILRLKSPTEVPGH